MGSSNLHLQNSNHRSEDAARSKSGLHGLGARLWVQPNKALNAVRHPHAQFRPPPPTQNRLWANQVQLAQSGLRIGLGALAPTRGCRWRLCIGASDKQRCSIDKVPMQQHCVGTTSTAELRPELCCVVSSGEFCRPGKRWTIGQFLVEQLIPAGQ